MGRDKRRVKGKRGGKGDWGGREQERRDSEGMGNIAPAVTSKSGCLWQQCWRV